MKIEYDEKKNQTNYSKHGIEFSAVSDLNWDSVISKKDSSKEYGEKRIVSYGFLNERLYVLVWTARDGSVRPISFRKANGRERKEYEEKTRIY